MMKLWRGEQSRHASWSRMGCVKGGERNCFCLLGYPQILGLGLDLSLLCTWHLLKHLSRHLLLLRCMLGLWLLTQTELAVRQGMLEQVLLLQELLFVLF